MSQKAYRSIRPIILFLALVLGLFLLAGCGQKAKDPGPFAGRTPADVSGYAGLKDYDKETRLTETTVQEIADLMKAGKTFAFYAGFAKCPWCNRLMPYLNDAALEQDEWIGYLNTRKDPSWKSNLDIDDYDLFVELFGEFLEYDADQIKHLYVPMLFYIKDGKVAAVQQGVIEGVDDPDIPLTGEQEQALKEILQKNFGVLK